MSSNPRGWLAVPTVSNALWPLLCFFVSANVLAVGITLLLSGLRELSLLRNRQARTAALVRLAATNLLLPCFVFAALTDGRNLNELLEANPGLEVIAFLALVPFVYVARTSILHLRSSWKYEAPSAEQVLRDDPRPLVVYLRSFAIDDEIVSTDGGLLGEGPESAALHRGGQPGAGAGVDHGPRRPGDRDWETRRTAPNLAPPVSTWTTTIGRKR